MLGMLDKKDKLAALIVSGGPKESEHEEQEQEMDMPKEAKKDAARQFLAAIERKDISGLVDAFELMRECYESED